MKFLIRFKIILLKIIKLNISFLKREISGYPEIVKKFEKQFSQFIGKKYGITFCNGTSSIEAAIYALNACCKPILNPIATSFIKCSICVYIISDTFFT